MQTIGVPKRLTKLGFGSQVRMECCLPLMHDVSKISMKPC